jgi:hypothetical protein
MPISGQIGIADNLAHLRFNRTQRPFVAGLGGQDGDDLKRVGIDDDDLIANQEIQVTLPRRFNLNDCLRQRLQIDETQAVTWDSLADANVEISTRRSRRIVLSQDHFPDSASLFAGKRDRRARNSCRGALAPLGLHILAFAVRLPDSVAKVPFRALSDVTPALAFRARLTHPRLRLG